MASALEKILWEGAPERRAFVARGLRVFAAGVTLLAAGVCALVLLHGSRAPQALKVTVDILSFPLFFVAALCMAMPWVFGRVHGRVRYAVTDRAIAIVGGMKDAAPLHVAVERVREVAIEKSLADRWAGTATLRFRLDRGQCAFMGLKDAGVVAEIVTRLMLASGRPRTGAHGLN